MVKIKFKLPNFMTDFGISRYRRNKIKKAINYKENELRGIEYTLCSGFRIIEQQITDVKKDGFNEENVRNILAKELNILSEHKNTLEIEVRNLKQYLSDDEMGNELSKLEKEEIKRL